MKRKFIGLVILINLGFYSYADTLTDNNKAEFSFLIKKLREIHKEYKSDFRYKNILYYEYDKNCHSSACSDSAMNKAVNVSGAGKSAKQVDELCSYIRKEFKVNKFSLNREETWSVKEICGSGSI